MPGRMVTVEWNALYAGVFPYHEHADEGEGVARGLFGALIVHAPEEVTANEHLVVLGDLETKNFKQLPGIADPITGQISMVGEFRGAHQYMHTINGKAYPESIAPFTATAGSTPTAASPTTSSSRPACTAPSSSRRTRRVSGWCTSPEPRRTADEGGYQTIWT